MDELLNALAGGQTVSGEELSRLMHITRAAVWKRIEKLRAQGYPIESGRKGYRLPPAPDAMDPAYWQGRLQTKWAGRPAALYAEEMTSTNTVLKKAAQEGAARGTLALCETQTSGKGRLGRAWQSPKGQGVWCSLLLRPLLKPGKAPLITLCAALAMARAVEKETGLAPQIKWPNDVVLDGKKICGILLEMAGDLDRVEYVVVGTGLNVGGRAYPQELQGKAGSLEEALGRPVNRARILESYLAFMEEAVEQVEQSGFQGIGEAYRARSCTLNRLVNVTGGMNFQGVAVDLDEEGALMVRREDGTICRVLAGDVSVRGVMGYV